MSYLAAYWQPIVENNLFFLPLLPFSVALPLSFWLFSKSFFDDDFKWQPSYYLWGMILIGIHTLLFLLNGYVWNNLEGDWKTLAKLPPYLLSISFVLMGLFEAIKNYNADLVIPRLRFRYPFVLLSALVMLLTLSSLMALQHDDLPLVIELVQKIGITLLVFYFSAYQLRLKNDLFQVPKTVPEEPNLVDEEILSKLMFQIEEKAIYLTEGLTIGHLAEIIEVKEYKLRKVINQYLDFRNFSEFLNTYRIKDACALLTDRNKKDLTIMEIAFKTGYNSLTPFNKAFKNLTGLTPTAYRKEKIF